MPYSPMGAQPTGFAPLQPFTHGRHMCNPSHGHWSMPGMHRVAAPSGTLSRGEPSATQSAVPQPSHLYMVGIQPWGLSRESPGPSALPT